MIITVDPSQSEDIAAFAMVKQYRMQALNVTLNGGTGSDAWQAVQGGEGYTQTAIADGSGMALIYEDPNAIVSYTVENDDTSNYDVASNAGIILSSIVPTPTNDTWTYTCVFHADSVPISNVDIDLLVYGNIARGTEQQGSPATAEEITAQVLEGLETRVTFLENGLKVGNAITHLGTITAGTDTKPIKLVAGVPTAVTNDLVSTSGNQNIAGIKTFTNGIIAYPEGWHPCATSTPQGKYGIFAKIHPTSVGAYHIFEFMQSSNTASAYGRLILHEVQNAPAPVWIDRSSRGGNDPLGINDLVVLSDGTDLYLAWKRTPPYGGLCAREYLGMSYGSVRSQGVNLTWYSNAEATILDNLDGYTVYDIADQTVHTYGAETIAGVKTYTGTINALSPLPTLNLQNTNGVTSSAPSSNYWDAIYFKDKNGANEGLISFAHYTSGVKDIFLQLNAENGADRYLHLFANNNGTAYATAPYRAYDPSHTTDVATIGTLDAYTPMVRTTGNQDVAGVKTITTYAGLIHKAFNIDTTTKPATNQFRPFIVLRDKNNVDLATMTYFNPASSNDGVDFEVVSNGNRVRLHIEIASDGGGLLTFLTPKGSVTLADTR